MIKAIDKNGKYVVIDEANSAESYFCPVCKQLLMIRRGEIREHHFSHIGPRGNYKKTYVPCSDTWHYDKTDWHIQWQKRFSQECYEIIFTDGNKKHIADIFINNTVIEFQHSPISLEEFRDRNSFYTALGYKVIWIFDLIEEYKSGKIHDEFANSWYFWSYAKKLFREMELEKEQATIFFQTTDDQNDATALQRITRANNRFRSFYVDDSYNLSIDEFVRQTKEGITFDTTGEHVFQKDKSLLLPSTQRIRELENEIKEGKTIEELWKPAYCSLNIIRLSTKTHIRLYGKDGCMRRGGFNRNYIVGYYMEKNKLNDDYHPIYDKKAYISIDDARKPIWEAGSALFRNDLPTLRKILTETQSDTLIVRNLWKEASYLLEIEEHGAADIKFSAYDYLGEGEYDGNSCKTAEVLKHYDTGIWQIIT